MSAAVANNDTFHAPQNSRFCQAARVRGLPVRREALAVEGRRAWPTNYWRAAAFLDPCRVTKPEKGAWCLAAFDLLGDEQLRWGILAY
jgi:hypothetical protein